MMKYFGASSRMTRPISLYIMNFPLVVRVVSNQFRILLLEASRVYYCNLFHDLLSSPISQHSVWSEITSHIPLH